MSLARLTVRAVVVSDGQSGRLAAVLDALAAQDPAPDHVDVVLAPDAPDVVAPASLRATLIRADITNFSHGVDTAVAASPGQAGEMLWLLHDDSAPLPGALAALTATARKRHRAEVIGAAQVRWDDPSRLVSLGTTTTRTGARRVTLVDEDDVNQGQYDARDDVLAVSMAGALVRRETWHRLEGLDPAYRGWGDSLDFCRRVWRSGGDVVVVPRARIRHAQESLYAMRGGREGSRRDTYVERRGAEWFHALVYAPWWAVPFLVIAALASSLWRAVTRVVRNDARMTAAELAVPARVVASLGRLFGARRRLTSSAGRGRRARAAEAALLATPRQVRHDVRVRQWGEYDTWRAASAPSDVVRGELELSRRRMRRALAATAVLLAAAAAVLHGDWILGILRGQMLVGDALGVTDAALGDLWDRGVGGWSEQGLGAPAIDGGLTALLVPLALVPGGLAVGLGLLLALAPLWAGLAAWATAGAVTRSVTFRVLAALVYGLLPPFIVAVGDGRLGGVLVHILLPLALLGILRAGGWHRGERVGAGEHFPAHPPRSSSAGMAGAVALALCVIASPLLMISALVGLAVLAGVSPGRRGTFVAIGVPTLVVGLPGVIAAVSQGVATADAWSVIAREPGPSAPSDRSVFDLVLSPWDGIDGVPSLIATVAAALVPVVLVAAALAVLGGRRWKLSLAGIAMVATGVAVAVAQAATVLSPDAGAGTGAANGWAGPGLTVAALGVLLATGAGLDGAWLVGRGATRVAVRVGAASMTLAVAVGVVGYGAALAWPGREDAATVALSSRDVVPLVAALEQEPPARQRVLVLEEGGEQDGDAPGEVTAAVLAYDGTDIVSTAGELVSGDRAAARTSGDAVVGLATLDDAVARLLGGESGAGQELAQWGIGVVVAVPGSASLEDSLAQAGDLALLGSSDRGTSWRILSDTGTVARAWLDTDGGAEPLAMGRSGGGVDVGSGGTAIVAVADDEAWTATLDGEPLVSVEDELGRVAFEVPRAGYLHVEYDDTTHRVWWWLGAATLVWAALGAVPLRARGFKEARA
ncbi:glycosyltransferase [Demequina sp. NBRC 110051]|uniref:glycosyltransferase n=1 Tax=Demequina sp. NBRC 110051 TaxID=1570340 RepID=UPI000A0023DF|nr:glycosyltransferase [Demequina sp. NBRC 110051]